MSDRFSHQTVRVVAYTQPEIIEELEVPDGYIGPSTIEEFIGFAAKVSNPAKQHENSERLLQYLREHAHWSPFEMGSMTLEIVTTRDIGRQILRHGSFKFQEFSQRYASVLDPMVLREARGQDLKNRQNSLDNMSDDNKSWWENAQNEIAQLVQTQYEEALERGIAKEQARAILPEGMTPTRMYMAGTVRSWFHYIDLREKNGTQLEHMDIANKAKDALIEYLPNLFQKETT